MTKKLYLLVNETFIEKKIVHVVLQNKISTKYLKRNLYDDALTTSCLVTISKLKLRSNE